ncbi:hypothetical protein EDB89DRAFT_1910283 [Lactarius sanguifluus]|nr:hypothetical protein EDB89DRAFT_1910283 [Lactarius sanguifluus]
MPGPPVRFLLLLNWSIGIAVAGACTRPASPCPTRQRRGHPCRTRRRLARCGPGLADHRIYVFSMHTGSLVRTLVGHELGVWTVNLVSHGGSLDPLPPSSNPDKVICGNGVPEVPDGPALLLHNRAPAGAQVLDPQGLDHHLPPSTRAALALDAQYPPIVPAPTQEIAFDGKVVTSGGLDTTTRHYCTAMLQGHTALFDDHRQFLVTGGNDGRLRLFDVGSGAYLRDITAPSYTVWKVVFRRKTMVEIWSFNPHEQIGEDRRVMVGEVWVLGLKICSKYLPATLVRFLELYHVLFPLR